MSIQAEQSVLGGLMIRPEGMAEVADWLREDHFSTADHCTIFRALSALIAEGKPVDPVTMADGAEIAGRRDLIRYMLELANTTPSGANVAAYGEIVVEAWRKRELSKLGSWIEHSAGSNKRAADVVAQASVDLAEISTDSQRGGLASASLGVKAFVTALTKRYESNDELTGLATPWTALNAATMGLQPGHLIVLAGRPSMGKTVLGLQLALWPAITGKRVAMFSLEMSSMELTQRAVACIGEIPHASLRNVREMQDQHWPRVTSASTTLKESALLIDDSAALTATQICARAKREHMRSPLSLVVVDHLHIVRLPGKSENATRELGLATQAFKALGKELQVPVVLLAQLNRANTQRADKRPTMADLRQSGDIEQDADIVALLHREDYYTPETHLRDVVELIIAKGRDIPSQTIHLLNRFDQMRADDWRGDLPKAPDVAPMRRGFNRSRGAA